jgi:type IV secretion system protein TrbJ
MPFAPGAGNKMTTHFSKRKRCFVLAALAFCLLLSQPAKALFGLPDLVFDPETWAEIGLVYQTAMQTYNSVKMEVNQIVYNAQHFSAKEFLRSFGTAFFRAYTRNIHGETQSWDETVNGGNPNSAPVAWQQSTITLEENPYIGSDPVGSEQLANLANIEIDDSVATEALTAIGNTSQAQQSADQALQNLENTALDSTDDTNSEVQQLNLIAGGAVQQLRYLQTLVSLQKTQVQLSVAQVKTERDRQVTAANFWTHYAQELVQTPIWGNVAGTFQQGLP